MRHGIAAALVAGFAGCGGDQTVGRSAQLFIIEAEGGEPKRLTEGERSYTSPSWSPDGRRLAVARGGPRGGAIELVTVDGDRRELVSVAPAWVLSLAWSPDGRAIAVGTHTDTDVARVEAIAPDGGTRRLLASSVTTDAGEPALSWAPTASALVYAGASEVRLRHSERRDKSGPPAPSVLVGRQRILVVSLRGGKPRPVSTGSADSDALWAPRGGSVLFSRRLRGELALFSAPAAGGRERKLVGGLLDAHAAWSPDTRQVAFSGVTLSGHRRYHLYVVDASGGRLRRLARDVVSTRPAWSPDGRLVAFAGWDGSVRVLAPDGAGPRTLTRLSGAEVRDLAWSPDGRRLAFTARTLPED